MESCTRNSWWSVFWSVQAYCHGVQRVGGCAMNEKEKCERCCEKHKFNDEYIISNYTIEVSEFPKINLKQKTKKKEVALLGDWNCDYQVEMVSTLNLQQAGSILHLHGNDEEWYDVEMPNVLCATIDYPLSKNVVVCIRQLKYKYHMDSEVMEASISPGYVFWVLAQVYNKIYKKPEEFGVWGHDIGDLVFEGLAVYEDGKVRVDIGS
jgi:hypothetical protein